MKRIILVLIAGIVLVGFCGLAFAEDEKKPDNADYCLWSNFKENSWVKLKMTMKTKIPGSDITTSTMITKTTLKEITEDYVVLETETEIPGMDNKKSTKKVLRKEGDEVTYEKKPNKEIEVAGKKFSCEVWVMTRKVENDEFVSTLWKHKDVQGGVLKVTTKRKDSPEGEYTIEMILIKHGESIKVKNKEIKCDVFKVSSNSGGIKMTGTCCASDEIPGSLFKMETQMKTEGRETEISLELEDYEAE